MIFSYISKIVRNTPLKQVHERPKRKRDLFQKDAMVLPLSAQIELTFQMCCFNCVFDENYTFSLSIISFAKTKEKLVVIIETAMTSKLVYVAKKLKG